MSSARTAEKQSAGGVVVARKLNDWHVALVRHTDGTWVLPKGHAEQGEPFEETAKREVQEETGIPSELLTIRRYLGAFAFNEQDHKNHQEKINHFFLMDIPSEIELPVLTPDVDHEEAAWHRLRLLNVPMRYPYQRQLLGALTLDP